MIDVTEVGAGEIGRYANARAFSQGFSSLFNAEAELK